MPRTAVTEKAVITALNIREYSIRHHLSWWSDPTEDGVLVPRIRRLPEKEADEMLGWLDEQMEPFRQSCIDKAVWFDSRVDRDLAARMVREWFDREIMQGGLHMVAAATNLTSRWYDPAIGIEANRRLDRIEGRLSRDRAIADLVDDGEWNSLDPKPAARRMVHAYAARLEEIGKSYPPDWRDCYCRVQKRHREIYKKWYTENFLDDQALQPWQEIAERLTEDEEDAFQAMRHFRKWLRDTIIEGGEREKSLHALETLGHQDGLKRLSDGYFYVRNYSNYQPPSKRKRNREEAIEPATEPSPSP